jgi:HK97 family phage major capsid protein
MTDNNNSQVVEAVKEEIKKLGDGYQANKKNYDSLRSNYEDLKDELKNSKSKTDVLISDKISKITDDITTRQEDIDTKFAKEAETKKQLDKRMDELEVALKRFHKAGTSDVEDLVDLESKATDFMLESMVVRGKGKGVKFNETLKPDMESYKQYKDAFQKFLRMDERHHMTQPDMMKSLVAGIDPDGGYTVTPQMSNRIITRLFESDPIRQMASNEKITTDAIEWLVDYDQAGFGWESETVAGAETTTPKIFKKRIPVHVMYAKPRVSQTLLEDSAINIENWLSDHIAKRFMRGEAAAFVSGDGVGKPRGFLTYSDYDTAGTDQFGRIEQQAMGAAAALTADGFIDVKYRLIEDYLNRATWLMNRLTVAAAMELKDGQGNYIWKPGLAEERHSTILGLPVRMSTTMPTVAANALSVAIADWSEAYMIVDRLGITIQRDPFTQKPMIEFYTRKRVGGDVINYQAIKLGVIST